MKFSAAARPLMILPALAAGCHLIDQRDFDANAGRPPVVPHVAAVFTPTPALVTIRYTTPDPHYKQALSGAVHRALARKPDVLFSVTTSIPAAPAPATQAEQAAVASSSGRDVAQTIIDAGAAPGQVEQSVRVQPGLAVREVQVNVH